MVRLNAKDGDSERGTIINFGDGTVAIHSAIRHELHGYVTFTTQEPHEINVGASNITYNTVEEMEKGSEVHMTFTKPESIKALISVLEETLEAMENL